MPISSPLGDSAETATAIGTLVLAGVTVVAILVALFQEKLRGFFSRAKLTVDIRKAPPDTHQIDLTAVDQTTGRVLWSDPAIYVRIRVTHEKGRPAENAEIILLGVWQRVDDGRLEQVSTFLPMSLRWSHVAPPTITTRVPKSGFRHCDLGHLVSTDHVARANPGLALPPGESRFWFDTIVQPNAVAGSDIPNMLPPGTYEVELLLRTRIRMTAEAS